MHERRFQKRLVEQLRAAGAVVLNKIGSTEEGPGWPDLWVGHRLWSGWLELKTNNHMPTPVQSRKIALLASVDVPVFLMRVKVDDNWELLVPIVKDRMIIEWRPYSTYIPRDGGLLFVLQSVTRQAWKAL